MAVPVSEFIKIQKNCNNIQSFESNVKAAVRDLVSHASITGKVSALDHEHKFHGLDIIYNDSNGMKVAVSVFLNKGKANHSAIDLSPIRPSIVDKLVVLTDSNVGQQKNAIFRSAAGASSTASETVVNIDRSRIADLIYFSNRYKNNQINGEDLERALTLAKSIKIC